MSPPPYTPLSVSKEAPEVDNEARRASASAAVQDLCHNHPPEEDVVPQETPQERNSPTRSSISTIAIWVPPADMMSHIGSQAAHALPYAERRDTKNCAPKKTLSRIVARVTKFSRWQCTRVNYPPIQSNHRSSLTVRGSIGYSKKHELSK